MIGHPHYFGPENRRRFAYVHWPGGEVRGAVLICPPIAYEEVCAHSALRLLGERLSDEGIVAMRIDYDGTGNSLGGDGDPDRVQAWQRSVDDAVDELRSFGLTHITIAGLRVGATLAALSRGAAAADGLVLWDPVVSGRRYGRSQQLIRTPQVARDGTQIADRVVVAGMELTSSTLAGLAATTLPSPPAGVRCLVIERDDAGGESPVAAGADVTHVRMPGTSELIDRTAETSETPDAILSAIVSWVRAAAPAPAPLRRPALRTSTLDGTGRGVLRHTAERIGPTGLLAITTVLDGAVAPGRAVVMPNNGAATSVGPGRAWVELASRVAREGGLAVRFDMSGLGDSPARPGRPQGEIHPVEAAEDIADAARHARSLGAERVALLGLCSGALLSFDGALHSSDIDLLIAINVRLDRPFTDRRRDRRLRAARPTARLLAIPLSKSPLFETFDRVPTIVWRILDRLRLVASPAVPVRRVLARGGARIVLVFGPGEWGMRALRRRDPRALARLSAHPALKMVDLPHLDHSMFNLDARRDVEEIVVGELHLKASSCKAAPT